MPLDQELFYRAKQGDKSSRDEIFRRNVGLVRACVSRYRGLAEPEDLFQQGALGLLKAIDRFDPSYGVEFSTYAVPVILGEIRRYLRDNLPLRVPRRLQELALRARRMERELYVSTGKEPSVADVARAVGVEIQELVEALESVKAPLGFHPAPDEASQEGAVSAREPVSAASETDYVDLKVALDELPARLKTIVLLRHFMGKTQTEVAEEMGMSQAQVSRLEREALMKLRRMVTG